MLRRLTRHSLTRLCNKKSQQSTSIVRLDLTWLIQGLFQPENEEESAVERDSDLLGEVAVERDSDLLEIDVVRHADWR